MVTGSASLSPAQDNQAFRFQFYLSTDEQLDKEDESISFHGNDQAAALEKPKETVILDSKTEKLVNKYFL